MPDPADQTPVADIAAASKYLDGIFGAVPQDGIAPGTPPAEAAPAVPGTPVQAAEVSAPDAPKEDNSLAALIRQQREDRQIRVARERENADYQTKLAAAEEKLSKLGKTDLVADPIAFAKQHGLTEAEMALVGQAYLYHLVPDRAPPDLRYKMLEAKTARERKLDDERRETEQRERASAYEASQIQQYTNTLKIAAQTWDQGTEFPESRAWFGGNHEEYAESLVHTARNIAESAQSRGEVADLSPKAVAAALERELAPRTQRIRGAGSKPTQPSVSTGSPVGGVQPTVLSTRGQGASPAPKATTEEERIKRAADVVFATR